MRAARTACQCTRSAVSRPCLPCLPGRPPAAALGRGVPEFLAPALARPWLWGRRGLRTTASPQPPQPPRLSRLPDPAVHAQIQPWLHALDALLPLNLRQQADAPPKSTHHVRSAPAIDYAWLLQHAQEASHDLLAHMILVEQRWDAVKWIARRLIEDGPPVLSPPQQLSPGANVIWPETDTIVELVECPIVTHRVRPSRRLRHTHSLDELTSAPESIELNYTTIKRALGQVWRCIGTMILVATKEPKNDCPIMSHALEIIAYLHHAALIPDSVYSLQPASARYALQQPPTIHLLSSNILAALSDASWRAHEASAKVAKDKMNAAYFLGREIPYSRFSVRVPQIAPALWLEFVLWTCLHGGWVRDGKAILDRMLAQKAECTWGAISWRQLQDLEGESPPSSGIWRLFGKQKDPPSKAEARGLAFKKISSEVVTAYIDGLVNDMRVGVGERGTHPEDIVKHIKKLKQLLDRSSNSLGSATWDSIMIRLLESGGVIAEKRPELLLSITGLASGFGSEVGSANASSETSTGNIEPPYYFEPSTTPISLLHRTIRSFIEIGDISGALSTLNRLQHYTDYNKQKSLQHFFAALKDLSLRSDQSLASRLPPIDFPAFDPQLPVPLLAKLLDFATDTKLYDLGRWLLLSKELDGPLISREMYDHGIMAAAIVRFGTIAGEKDLVLKIVKKTGTWNDKQQTQRLPHALFTTLLSSQVHLHRWESVRSIQNYVLENPGYRPKPGLLATFAAELLRLSKDTVPTSESEKTKACDAFANLLFAWEGLVIPRLNNELYSILGVVSSVHDEWKVFCSKFLAFSTRQEIKLSTEDFNQLLAGVLDGYDSEKGKELVETWCYKPPKTFEPYRAPGGLPTMPRFRVGKGEEYESRPEDINITQPLGASLVIQGRVHPNRQTVWAILRKVQQEEELRSSSGIDMTDDQRVAARETLKWAARLLYYLGFDHEDITRDLGSLAEMANLEHPPSPKLTGTP